MPNKAKVFLSLLLCGLLIYNSLGHFFVLNAMKLSVRKYKWAQLHQLPESQLEKFIFDKKSSNKGYRIINKREIEVKGNLYDVVSRIETDSHMIFNCVHDKKEQSLIAKIRNHTSRTNQPINASARLLWDSIIKIAIFNSTSFCLVHKPFQCLFGYTKPLYINPIILSIFQPPDFNYSI